MQIFSISWSIDGLSTGAESPQTDPYMLDFDIWQGRHVQWVGQVAVFHNVAGKNGFYLETDGMGSSLTLLNKESALEC